MHLGKNETGFSQNWWRMTRCPALPTLSELDNKIGSVSCLRPRRLCDSVVLPLVILRQHGLTQIETAQQDCGEEDHGERMYMWSEWGYHFSLSLTVLDSLLLIQVLGAKQRWFEEKGKLEILKYSRGDTQADKSFFASGQCWDGQCWLDF